MIELDNRTDDLIDVSDLQTIAMTMTDKEIELILTDDVEIGELNREFRDIDSATDVLSFPYEPMPMSPLGSIVISMDYVNRGAKHFMHRPQEELSLLFIHGLLHLLGYDHETDDGEMRQKEREIIGEFSLPSSLIVRTLKETD